MAIATLNDIIAAYTSGNVLQTTFRKVSNTPEAVNVPQSLWRVGPLPAAGGDGAAGSGTPGAGGTALDQADGSLSKGWGDQSPDVKVLLNVGARTLVTGWLVLVDRLVSVSGISLSSTGNKNVGSVALPRYTTGEGVNAWLEVTTATTTTAPVVSMNSYTDQDGNSGQAGPTVTFPAAATNLEVMVQLPLLAGDWGIRECTTINVATAAAAGAANFILTKEIARVPLDSAGGRNLQLYRETMQFQTIEDGASLMLYYVPNAANVVTVEGVIGGVYG